MSNILSAYVTKQPNSMRYRYSTEISKRSRPRWNSLLDLKDTYIEVKIKEDDTCIYQQPNSINVTVFLVNDQADEDGTYLPHAYTLHGPKCENGYYQAKHPGNQPIRIPYLLPVKTRKKDDYQCRENLRRVSSFFDQESKFNGLMNLSPAELPKKFSSPVRFSVQIELGRDEHDPIRIYTNSIDDRRNPTGTDEDAVLTDADEYQTKRLVKKKRKPEVDDILKDTAGKKARLGVAFGKGGVSGTGYDLHSKGKDFSDTSDRNEAWSSDSGVFLRDNDPYLNEINPTFEMTNSDANELYQEISKAPSLTKDLDKYLMNPENFETNIFPNMSYTLNSYENSIWKPERIRKELLEGD